MKKRKTLWLLFNARHESSYTADHRRWAIKTKGQVKAALRPVTAAKKINRKKEKIA